MVERVIPASEKLLEFGAKTYKPILEKVTPEACAAFVSRAIKSGKRVFDIGRELGNSPFYSAEIKSAAKAGFERVPFKTVELEGQTIQVFEWIKKTAKH